LKCNLHKNQWTKLNVRETGDKSIALAGMVFDPGKKERSVVGYSDGYIVISNDSCKTWKPLKPEHPFFVISRMAVTANRKLVVAGNGTIYTLDLSRLK
jgi:hypothetical protein